MPQSTQHFSTSGSYAITNNASTTAEVDISLASSGEIFVPTGSSLTSLTFYVAPRIGGTYIAAYDSAGTPAAVTLTVSAAKAYPIPTAIMGAPAFRMVGNAAGTVDISLKT